MKLYPDIDRSAGISCAATAALRCPMKHTHKTHHERQFTIQTGGRQGSRPQL